MPDEEMVKRPLTRNDLFPTLSNELKYKIRLACVSLRIAILDYKSAQIDFRLGRIW